MEPSAKRRRLDTTDSPTRDSGEYEASWNNLQQKFKSKLEAIFDKYDRDFTGIGDEIDLRTGRIVVNNGHLAKLHDEDDVGRSRVENGSETISDDEDILGLSDGTIRLKRLGAEVAALAATMPVARDKLEQSLSSPLFASDAYGRRQEEPNVESGVLESLKLRSDLQSRFAKAAAAAPLASGPATDPKWQTPEVPELLLTSKLNTERATDVNSQTLIQDTITRTSPRSSPGDSQKSCARRRSWTTEEIVKLKASCLNNKPSLRELVQLFPYRVLSDIRLQRATIEGDITSSREGSISAERGHDAHQDTLPTPQDFLISNTDANEVVIDDMDFGGDVSLDSPRDHSNPHATSSIEEILGEIPKAPSQPVESDYHPNDTNERPTTTIPTCQQASPPLTNDGTVVEKIARSSDNVSENVSVTGDRSEAAPQEQGNPLKPNTLSKDPLFGPALTVSPPLQQLSGTCCSKETLPVEMNSDGAIPDKPLDLQTSTDPDLVDLGNPAINARLATERLVQNSNVEDSASAAPEAASENISDYQEGKLEPGGQNLDSITTSAEVLATHDTQNDSHGFIIPQEQYRFEVPVQDFIPSLSGFREDVIIPNVDPLPFELYIGEESHFKVEAPKVDDLDPSAAAQATNEFAQAHDFEPPIDPALSGRIAPAHPEDLTVTPVNASVQTILAAPKRGEKRRTTLQDRSTQSKKRKSSSPRDLHPAPGSSIWREMISSFGQHRRSKSRSMSENRENNDDEGTIVLKPGQSLQPTNETQQKVPSPVIPLSADTIEVRAGSNISEVIDEMASQQHISEISTESNENDSAAPNTKVWKSIEGSIPAEESASSNITPDIVKPISGTEPYEIAAEGELIGNTAAHLSSPTEMGSLNSGSAKAESEKIAVEVNPTNKHTVLESPAHVTSHLVEDKSSVSGREAEEIAPNSAEEMPSGDLEHPALNLEATPESQGVEIAIGLLENHSSMIKDGLIAIAEAAIEGPEKDEAPMLSADIEPSIISKGKTAVVDSFEESTSLTEDISTVDHDVATGFADEKTNPEPASNTEEPKTYQGKRAICDSFEEPTSSAEDALIVTTKAVATTAEENMVTGLVTDSAQEASIGEEAASEYERAYDDWVVDQNTAGHELQPTAGSSATHHGSSFASQPTEKETLYPANSQSAKSTPVKKRRKTSSTPASASKPSLRKSLFSLHKRKSANRVETPRKGGASSSQRSRLSLSSLVGDDSEDELTFTSPSAAIKTPSRTKAVANIRSPRCGCDEVMRALEACHERGFIWKLFGNCNAAKREVNRCLAGARAERTARNREDARQGREKVERRWKEIEEES